MSISKSNLLIVLPSFNEASLIENVLTDIQNEGYCNICLIDDGSSDVTFNLAKQFDIDILRHPINRGAGAAIQTGIIFARNKGYEYAVLMDSDGQHLASDIKILMDKMESENADIVIGNRFAKKDNRIPQHRKFYNNIANWFTRLYCIHSYSDTQSGFRLLNRKAIELLDLKSRGFGFCSEMIIQAEKLKLNIGQIPITVLYTKYSLSKGQNLNEGFRTARNILWHQLFK